MPLSLVCPQCRKRLKILQIPSRPSTVRCPKCQQSIAIVPPTPVAAPEPMPMRTGFSGGVLAGIFLGACLLLLGSAAIAYFAYQLGRSEEDVKPNRVAEKSKAAQSNKPEAPPANIQKVDETKQEVIGREVDAQKRQDEFDVLMAEGAQAMADRKYSAAFSAYDKALALFPDSTAAAKGLNDAQAGRDNLDTDQQRNANAALKKQADTAFADMQFDQAVKLYQRYLALAEGDVEAQARLATAKEALAKQAAQKVQMDQYNALVADAQAAYAAKNLALAREKIAAARKLVPDSPALDDLDRQIAAAAPATPPVEKVGPKVEANKGPDLATFDLLVKQAAQATTDHRWTLADKLYGDALLIVDDPLVKRARLALQDLKAASLTRFDNRVAAGNLALLGKRPAAAIKAFTEANAEFPENDVIPGLIAQAQTLDTNLQLYSAAMDQGRGLMKQKSWTQAIRAFDAALNVFPQDPPATQLRAEAVKAKETPMVVQPMPGPPTQEQLRRYNKAMKDGNKAMDNQMWNAATLYYQAALNAIPNDPDASQGLDYAKKKMPLPKKN
jgi:tetratricopeptide (TPR) repeat protein